MPGFFCIEIGKICSVSGLCRHMKYVRMKKDTFKGRKTMPGCTVCPRECGGNRAVTPGRCGVGEEFVVARAALHHWEDPCISGTKGSGAVFFSGCPLGCVYCQNDEISRGCFGKTLSAGRLQNIFYELIAQGAHNINLVSPTHYTERLASLLRETKLSVPVVWNSSGYEKPQALALLPSSVSIFLPDFKYGDRELAVRYSAAPDYFERASKAILYMAKRTGPPQFDEQGLLKSGVIIRHLVLPGAYENTRRVIDWVAETFAKGQVLFSLMGQYIPCGRAGEFEELKAPIRQDDYDWAVQYMASCGMEDGYVQSHKAASPDFIPAFDGQGV